MKQKWSIPSLYHDVVRLLAENCDIGILLARVLVARGLTSPQQVKRFLDPLLSRDWRDPLEIHGLESVADALESALRSSKRIMVYGDFDVDGLSATALMVRALSALNVQADYLIPHRIDEGYGFTSASLQRILARKPEFVLTVDCGISAAKELAYLVEQGIQVAVTDHHEPSDSVPSGIPVADPKLDPSSSSADLAGVGLALKLIALIGARFGQPDLWRDLTDLAALGTIADLVPLSEENRALVSFGLDRMAKAPRPGIAALMTASQTSSRCEPLSASDLSFSLIPRLNAAGRMGDPTRALDLLLSNNPLSATDSAAELEELNRQRRAVEADLTQTAIQQVKDSDVAKGIIIVAGEDWHEGVRGIVASRLVHRFAVPALVFSLVGDEARGSGRSLPGINIFALIEGSFSKAVRFGGHEGAVGITLRRADLPEFTEALQQAVANVLKEGPVTSIPVDTIIRLSDLTVPAVRELALLEPCGQGNRQPRFLLQAVFPQGARKVGADKNHLSFSATDGKESVSAIYFNCPDGEQLINWHGLVDILCRLEVDEWNGRCRVKLMVEAIEIRNERASTDNLTPLAPPAATFSLAVESEEESLNELTLHEVFLGPAATLHKTQAAALDLLRQNKSVLTVMATGRGKSLIFHIHAAHLALTQQKTSVFVYPLRALIADQGFHLKEQAHRLGIVVRTLTGETPIAERDALFAELFAGKVHILLTTPEFLLFHGWRLEESGRIAFVVLDEAHHLATELSDSRPAYHYAEHLRKTFTHAQFLAVTATASDEEARRICTALGITHLLVDHSQRPNLSLDDARTAKDRTLYLANLIAQKELSLIYVNSRAQTLVLAKALRDHLREQGERIAFYHAGLPRETRLAIEAAFRGGQLDALVSTSAFGEGVNLPGIRHVIHYEMPFSLIAFNQQSGRAGRDGKNAVIHLLSNNEDVLLNRALLARMHPSRESLAILYRVVREQWEVGRPVDQLLPVCEDELLSACCAIDQNYPLDTAGIGAALMIFSQLGLIELSQTDAERLFTLTGTQGKVDLSDSSRYREGQEAIRAFEEFRRWFDSAQPDELLASLNRPIAPTLDLLADIKGD